MREIMAKGGDYGSNWLFFLTGGFAGLEFGTTETIDYWGLPLFLLRSMFFGGLLATIINNIMVFALSGTQKWFHGKGELVQIRNAIAWALVPFLLFLPVFLLKLNSFRNVITLNHQGILLGQYIRWDVLISECVIWTWSFVLMVNTLSVVQGYSLFKAFLHLLTASLLLLSPFMVILGLFRLLT